MKRKSIIKELRKYINTWDYIKLKKGRLIAHRTVGDLVTEGYGIDLVITFVKIPIIIKYILRLALFTGYDSLRRKGII